MTASDSFFAHWYFHVPNLVLAALLYSVIARYALELMFSRRPDAVIVQVFRTVTDPVLKLVRLVTPAVVPNGLVLVLSIVWLMSLRMFLYLTVLAAGVRNFT
jgi:YggT family protein